MGVCVWGIYRGSVMSVYGAFMDLAWEEYCGCVYGACMGEYCVCVYGACTGVVLWVYVWGLYGACMGECCGGMYGACVVGVCKGLVWEEC